MAKCMMIDAVRDSIDRLLSERQRRSIVWCKVMQNKQIRGDEFLVVRTARICLRCVRGVLTLQHLVNRQAITAPCTNNGSRTNTAGDVSVFLTGCC